MRWIVGDVQGCARELERLLKAMRFERRRDELWSLGDLVNRGPDSLEVLRIWKDLGARGVIGNHDAYALLARSGARKRHPDSLEPLFRAADADELLGLLRRLPVLVRLPAAATPARDVWIVHAGLKPAWTDLEALAPRLNGGVHDDAWLRSSDVRFALRVRYCTREGKLCGDPLGGPAPPGCEPWDRLWRGAAFVVHGHWALRGYYRGERTMGLDSGCVYGGALTAWCQDEDRIVQVPARV
jgi:bis(5'-nucleosyl)-tetraphosphatase (symmetrical)